MGWQVQAALRRVTAEGVAGVLGKQLAVSGRFTGLTSLSLSTVEQATSASPPAGGPGPGPPPKPLDGGQPASRPCLALHPVDGRLPAAHT